MTTLQLILQPFRHLTYITTHSPTLPSLYLRHSSFSNPSVALPTSQVILQRFFRFSYVISSSLIHLASRPWKEPLWRASIPGIYRIPNIKWPDFLFWTGQYRFSTCCPSVPKDFVGTPHCPILLKNWNWFSIFVNVIFLIIIQRSIQICIYVKELF